MVKDDRFIFDQILENDFACWSEMIYGYAESNEPREALKLLNKMVRQIIVPDHITMLCVISACSHVDELVQGKWIHTYIDRNGFGISLFVALMDIYAKCENYLDCVLVAIKFDNFETHLTMLLTKSFAWKIMMLQGSFANEYFLMKLNSLKCIFQLYQLIAMTMNYLDTLLQSNMNRRIFVVVGAYSTEHELECNELEWSNHNLFPVIVSIASQVVYFFMILRLDSRQVIVGSNVAIGFPFGAKFQNNSKRVE